MYDPRADLYEEDEFDEEAAAALDEVEGHPAPKRARLEATKTAPAPTTYQGRLQSEVNLDEEAELRRLEGAPPPVVDLTDSPTDSPKKVSGTCHLCGQLGHW